MKRDNATKLLGNGWKPLQTTWMMMVVATAVVVAMMMIVVVVVVMDSLVLVRNLSKSCYMTHLSVVSNFCDFSL